MSRRNQQHKILELLAAARGNWVPLPQMLALKISQFGARILELRREGHIIRNKTEHKDGQVLSWYRLEPTLGCSGVKAERISSLSPPARSFPEFGNLAPERYGVD